MSAAQPFVEQFAAARERLPGGGLPWLGDRREAGIERFAALGLPTPRLEDWKYTNLRPLEKLSFGLPNGETAKVEALPSLLPAGAAEHRLVFVNGAFRADLSRLDDLPAGVTLSALSDQLLADPGIVEAALGRIGEDPDQALVALNDAMMSDGLVLRVGRGTEVVAPIEVVFVGAAQDRPLTYHPRTLVVMEAQSSAVLIEHHVSLGGGATLANGVTEIDLAEGARLHHYKMQDEGPEAFHLATVQARVGRNALYDAFGMSLGARIARNQATVLLEGEGAVCHLNGAYMARGKQHCDNTTVIEHKVPHTSCREVFKGVLDDEARAVFQGRIVVHPDAQQSDGHQLSKTMLLSERAEIDAKPELEIYADDVKCSHGATSGDLDHDALFYLRSRGVPEARARSILVEAFLSETVEAIAAADLCPAFLASIADWLHQEAPE